MFDDTRHRSGAYAAVYEQDRMPVFGYDGLLLGELEDRFGGLPRTG
jgi:hypothetical protein